jgi:Protein of unknown function (DUF2490)
MKPNNIKKTKDACIFLLLISLLLPSGSFLTADTRSWLSNSLTYRMNAITQLQLSNEFRFNDTLFSGYYLQDWQIGIWLRVFKYFQIGAGYMQQHTKDMQYKLEENRWMIQAAWTPSISPVFQLACRFLAEGRQFEEQLLKDHFRFRLRILLNIDLKISSFNFHPYIGIEPFFDTISNETRVNRIYAGLRIPLQKWLSIKTGYIRQDQKNYDTIHIINTGVLLSF